MKAQLKKSYLYIITHMQKLYICIDKNSCLFLINKENTCMPNNQLVSRALDMLTKMYSCGRANES